MAPILLIVFICYVMGLVLFSFYRGPELEKSHKSLLKSFFPNWRFFENLQPSLVLYFCHGLGERDFKQPHWQRLVAPRKRKIFSLFLNARNNFYLYQSTVIENFTALAIEMQKSPLKENIEQMGELRDIRGWIESSIATATHYKFKIVAMDSAGKETAVLTSAIFEKGTT